jgi:hypothetical protein
MWVALVVVVLIGILFAFHDPFDFDDRPHLERLLRLALIGVQSDIAVDMNQRIRAQVELGKTGNLGSMSENEWEAAARTYLSDNNGCLGIEMLDNDYNARRSATIPVATHLFDTVNVRSDARV